MLDIYSQTLEDLETYFENLNENKAKAKILFRAISNGLTDFNKLYDIKKSLREKLSQDFYFNMPVCVKNLKSENVEKFLFSLYDDNIIESVLMRQTYGNSVCVSSQIGCNMACDFCQSGKNKKVRNLTCSEMVSQVYYIKNSLNTPIKTIAIMGIGEPFDNYDEVTKFLDIITNPYGMAIGSTRLTLSTCGIVPKIYDFCNRDTIYNLAISLHAPNDELRNKIMPINKAYGIEELIKSLMYYTEKTNKKVFVEYVMIKNINDNLEQAKELASILKDLKCTVNLIPYNTTDNDIYEQTDFDDIILFYRELRKYNIHATIRKEFGKEIDGACGQLRNKYLKD